MPDKPSDEAKDLTTAQRNIKEAVRQFMLLEITCGELNRTIKKNVNSVPKRYKSKLNTFAKRYLRQYIYIMFGISFAYFMNFVEKHPKTTLKELPQAKRYFIKTGDQDAEVLSPQYQARLRQTTAKVLQGRTTTRFVSDAEAEALHDRQTAEVESLRKSGNKLVVCSSHADCSDLCRPYQGKVYSLDGTSGRTKDGRSFSPLEDTIGPTKLFHKWCKHRISAYKKGEMAPHLTREEQQRESSITSEQRRLERKCRYHNERRETWKGIDPLKEEHYKRTYADSVNEYYKYCNKNDRDIIKYRLR